MRFDKERETLDKKMAKLQHLSELLDAVEVANDTVSDEAAKRVTLPYAGPARKASDRWK